MKEDKIYPIESHAIKYKMGFEGDVLYVYLMFRRVKEFRVGQVTKVIIKKPPIGLGDEIQFRIFFIEEGTEKKIPWIPAKMLNPITAEFFEDLRSRIPSNVIWEDRREETTSKNIDGQKAYDLQYYMTGYAGAGLSRTMQIWMPLVLLAVLILPLFYYVYLLASGGYRIYTSDAGLRIRKTRDTLFEWNDLHVAFKRIKITRNYVTQTQVLEITLSDSTKKKSVVMRYDHAKLLIKELVERKILGEEVLNDFV